jgi:hypothetical protein
MNSRPRSSVFRILNRQDPADFQFVWSVLNEQLTAGG